MTLAYYRKFIKSSAEASGREVPPLFILNDQRQGNGLFARFNGALNNSGNYLFNPHFTSLNIILN